MHWQGRIVAMPGTLGGKPRIANTRIGVVPWTVPFHQGRDIAPTLLRHIAKVVGLTIDEFFRHR